MKKKTIKSTLAVATLVASAAFGYTSYTQNHYNQVAYTNPLIEENIEALADGESSLLQKIASGVAKVGSKTKRVCSWLGAIWTCYEIADELWGRHTEWEEKVYDTSTRYSNGQVDKHQKLVRKCISKDNFGSDACTLGDIQVINI